MPLSLWPPVTREGTHGHRKGSSSEAGHVLGGQRAVELLAQVTNVLPEPRKDRGESL